MLSTRSRIRLSIRIKVVTVRLFFDWSVLDLTTTLTVGWLNLLRYFLMMRLFYSRWLMLMAGLFHAHTLVHCLNTTVTFMTSILRWFWGWLVILSRVLCVSDTAFKISKLILSMSLLFHLLLSWQLWVVFTAIRMDWRTPLFVLVFPLFAGYFFHIRALRSRVSVLFLFYNYLVVSVRLLSFPVLYYLNLRSLSGAHLALLITLVIGWIIILG